MGGFGNRKLEKGRGWGVEEPMPTTVKEPDRLYVILLWRGSDGSASGSILGSALQGLQSDEELERGPGKWRRINLLYECDRMNVYML